MRGGPRRLSGSLSTLDKVSSIVVKLGPPLGERQNRHSGPISSDGLARARSSVKDGALRVTISTVHPARAGQSAKRYRKFVTPRVVGS